MVLVEHRHSVINVYISKYQTVACVTVVTIAGKVSKAQRVKAEEHSS